ncbi:MAG: tyrosine--tRNA ligase [Polyangiaceae bacterium]|nr:tyrosine--tRNA ligase [Polyangiaceae bacterium]
MVPAQKQMEVLCRGIVDLHVRAELEERLASGRPLKVKAGFDPTRPDLHLGHTVLMQKMRQFQEFGHTVIFVVGDFTAMVGDPTGQNDSRPRLTRDEVMRAAATYQEQAFKVLDRERTVVRYNSEWLDKLGAVGMIELGAKYTVARMLERDDFSKRFEEQRPIHVHEFLYPLLQAYDSVALDCDIELGGTDQLFNLLVGRDLMPRYGLRAQMVMTTPILEGTDARIVDGKLVGKKMSKSADNYVGISEPPFEMFQKLMLIDDAVIWRFMDLLSAKSNEEIAQLKADVYAGKNGIITVKEAFAAEIVTRFWSAADADAALERRRNVAKGGLPENIETVHLNVGDRPGIKIANAMKEASLAPSTSEALRLVRGGAVYIGETDLPDAATKDEKFELQKGRSYLLRVGSKNRRFCKITVD